MLTAAKTQLQELSSFHVTDKTILSQDRVISVDALRGFDMFWIMGGGYIFIGLDKVFNNQVTHFIKEQCDHVEWFGFRFWDIIMPLFMFLAGVSMVFSFRKRLFTESSHKALWKHTIKRVAILWLLGLIVQGNLLTYDIEQIKLYSNTLQAIASGYLIATVIILYLPVSFQVIATAGLLLSYWAIAVLIPVNGSTMGAYTSSGNVLYYIDHLILGSFQNSEDYAWIIPSLNFGATTMLGVFCGYILQSRNKQVKKFVNLAILGASLIAIGLIWDNSHPIIKKLWTGSFVLFSGGICALMLAFSFLLIDMWKIRTGTKWLIILGSNAILGYVAWHLFEPAFNSMSSVFIDGLKPYIGNWYDTIFHLGSFLVIFFVLKYMYKKKIFVKI